MAKGEAFTNSLLIPRDFSSWIWEFHLWKDKGIRIVSSALKQLDLVTELFSFGFCSIIFGLSKKTKPVFPEKVHDVAMSL